MKLTWKGPFERHDSRTSAAPSNPSHDVQSGKVSKTKYIEKKFLNLNAFLDHLQSNKKLMKISNFLPPHPS